MYDTYKPTINDGYEYILTNTHIYNLWATNRAAATTTKHIYFLK